jgi:hypothetical protein
MSDSTGDKAPTLSAPLKLMAISAAGAILSFGLCTANVMKNPSMANAGAIAFFLFVPIFTAAVLWLVVNLIRRANRRWARRNS